MHIIRNLFGLQGWIFILPVFMLVYPSPFWVRGEIETLYSLRLIRCIDFKKKKIKV